MLIEQAAATVAAVQCVVSPGVSVSVSATARSTTAASSGAAANFGSLPVAVGMPNRWPTHPGGARQARRWLEAVPSSRRLPALKAVPRLDALLSQDLYGEIA